MRYETPQIVELTVAIIAIQSAKDTGPDEMGQDSSAAYEDWE